MGKGATSEVSLTKVWIENNLDRPFDGGGGSGGVGPTGSNSGGANEVLLVDHTNIHHRDEYVSSSPISSCLDAQYSSVCTNNSQHFHLFSSYSDNPYKSPGEMVPLFTNAQWTELERQAMIYKYMISSVPVPSHLLHPTYASYNNNVGYSKNGAGGLVEPGRCKRTDGKKWRCSRDVAPHQKYCERHLHRGRPRSRKPVEINNNNKNTNLNNGDDNHKKPRLQQTPKQHFTPATANNTNLNTISATPSYKGSNRDLGLMMESEMASMNGALLELSNMGFPNEEGSSAIFHQGYMDQHVLSYSNYPEAPIGLIDAWSVDDNNNNILNSITNQNVNIESADHENFNPWLNLSIAMASSGNVLDDEMGVGKGADFCDDGASWLNSVSWEQFGPGGPLAEAFLRNPVSPQNSVGGPTATAVSSPSGVIQRTLFSSSDSSVCNSPPEIAFHRIKYT